MFLVKISTYLFQLEINFPTYEGVKLKPKEGVFGDLPIQLGNFHSRCPFNFLLKIRKPSPLPPFLCTYLKATKYLKNQLADFLIPGRAETVPNVTDKLFSCMFGSTQNKMKNIDCFSYIYEGG